MARLVVGQHDKLMGNINVHFDVRAHHIPVDLFVEVGNDISAILAEFDRLLFGGTLKYQIVVLTPQPGTFLGKFGVYLLGGAAAVWAALDTNIGEGFVKGLTGEAPAFWSEQAGKTIREAVSESIRLGEENISKSKHELQTMTLAAENVLAESTRCILEKPRDQLQKVGLSISNFREGYQARNNFYVACSANTEVKAIGFTPAAEFPIKRKQFPSMQTTMPKKREEEFEGVWQVKIFKIKVTSPNWDKDDVRRTWKGKIEDGKDCYFRVDDEGFWFQAMKHQLELDVVDSISVQMAFREIDGQPRDYRAIKVLEYNGRELAPPLNDNAIAAILGSFAVHPQELKHPDLFGFKQDLEAEQESRVSKTLLPSTSMRLLSRKIKFDD
jgi:hypothetical protein